MKKDEVLEFRKLLERDKEFRIRAQKLTVLLKKITRPASVTKPLAISSNSHREMVWEQEENTD